MRRLLILLLGASVVLAGAGTAACGSGEGTDEEEQTVGVSGPVEEGEAVRGADGGAGPAEGSAEEGEQAGPGDEADAAVSGSYETGLAAVAAALELELEAIGALVQGAAAAQETLVTLEEALPRLVSALRAAVEGVARLDPPPDLAGEHELLLAGLQEIVALEEELATRVEAGDAAGALARVEAIAARQARLEASLSATMLTAAGPLLGVAGALGFLPLGPRDLAPSTAAELPPVDAESYLGRLDFPGSERLLALDPLVVGGTVLITAQWAVPASAMVEEVLDFYEAALRDLGAAGESQRLGSGADGAVTVGTEHPFGSAIVMLGAGEDGSHLVSVTGSFPASR